MGHSNKPTMVKASAKLKLIEIKYYKRNMFEHMGDVQGTMNVRGEARKKG